MIAIYGILVAASTFNGNVLSHILAVLGVVMSGISDSMIALRVTGSKDRTTRVMAIYMIAAALILAAAYCMAV